MKDSLKLSMLLIGTVIGAGFASGREIVNFYCRFGTGAIPLVLVTGLLFFFCFLLLLGIGSRIKSQNIEVFNKAVFGKFSIMANIILLFNYVMIIGTMFGGCDEILPSVKFPILSIATAVLALIVLLAGAKGLVRFNVIIVPLLVILMIVTPLLNLFGMPIGESTFVHNATGGVVSAVIYVGLNLILSAGVLAGIDVSLKTRLRVSATSAIIITVLLALVVTTTLRLGDAIYFAPMPMLALAANLNIAPIASIIIWCGIFTTILSAVYVVSEWLIPLVKRRWLAVLITIVLGWVLSRFGFVDIVSKFYPISGALGVLLLLACLRYDIRETAKSVGRKMKKHQDDQQRKSGRNKKRRYTAQTKSSTVRARNVMHVKSN